MFKPLQYHRTLHLHCSVEAIKGLDHAISTAVMAMKLQLVTDAETLKKKKLIHHSVMITCYDMSTHALATQKETEKMFIMSYTWTHPWCQ